MFLKRVINLVENKNRIVKNLHNKSNYKDKEDIYR